MVHSGMERDVGLLRLYPGIPATLVCTPFDPRAVPLPGRSVWTLRGLHSCICFPLGSVHLVPDGLACSGPTSRDGS